MRRLLRLLGLPLALVGSAGAATMHVVQNQDCTGIGTASVIDGATGLRINPGGLVPRGCVAAGNPFPCCTGSQTGDGTNQCITTTNSAYCCIGVGQGVCNRKRNVGDVTEVETSLVLNGTYTAGGNRFGTGEFSKIGLTNLMEVRCEVLTAGTDPPASIRWVTPRRVPQNTACFAARAPFACCSGLSTGSCTGQSFMLQVWIAGSGAAAPAEEGAAGQGSLVIPCVFRGTS